MTLTESVVLQLVAHAINVDYDLDLALFKDVNWKQVYQTAKGQGVAGVALDAIEALPLNCRPPRDVLIHWIGYVCSMEKAYSFHKNAIYSLANFYYDNGFTMMLLKGYGLSLCWPKPEHRPVGDIDIFLGKRNTHPTFGHKNVWKAGDNVIKEKLGIDVDNSHHHHSVFLYKGISVENHFDFINAYDHKSSRKIEEYFKQIVRTEYCQTDTCKYIYIPSCNFNALFILKHCSGHFASTEINIRQVLDWLLFIRKYNDSIDWKLLYSQLDTFGLTRFANILSSIGVDYLGMPVEIFYKYENDKNIVKRVLNDILSPEFSEYETGSLLSGLWVKPRRFWKNRWKHRLCYSDSFISGFIWTTYAKLLKPRHFRI